MEEADGVNGGRPTKEQYQAELLVRAAWLVNDAWRKWTPMQEPNEWCTVAGRWLSDYERMDEVVDPPAEGIFGTGIDLSALDADTAWRLGLWVGQLIKEKEEAVQQLNRQRNSQLPTRYRGKEVRGKEICGAKHDHGRCGLPPDGHNRHRAKTPYGEVEWNDPVRD